MTDHPGERPLDASGEHRQDEQAELITNTDNGPTDDDEEAVLSELYGAPDTDGVYGPHGDDQEEETGGNR